MRRLLGRGVLALGVLALVLATAACGGSSGAEAEVASATGAGAADGASAEDASTGEADFEQAGLDFARCMREHGVDMPDPQAGEGGFIKVGPINASSKPLAGGAMTEDAMPEEFREADEACRHFLEDLIQEGGPPMDAAAQDKALMFAKCMREHGVDMPDPDFSGGGGGVRIEVGAGGVDPGSDTFQDAQEACGELFGPDGPMVGRAGVATSGGKS